MLMVLHGNDGVHTHNRGSKDILGATTRYTPVMTIKYGTALKSNTDYELDLMARTILVGRLAIGWVKRVFMVWSCYLPAE